MSTIYFEIKYHEYSEKFKVFNSFRSITPATKIKGPYHRCYLTVSVGSDEFLSQENVSNRRGLETEH